MGHAETDLTDTNGGKLLSTSAILLILSWISLGLRAYTRAILMTGFQIDDWLMILSEGIFTIYVGFLTAGVHYGIGRHNAAIGDDKTEVLALKWQALAIGTYILLMMFIKLSIGVFLLRIASRKVYVWILRVSLIVITVWSTTIFFWNIFQCDPVNKQWDYLIKDGHCVAPEELVYAAYALSTMTILSDWLYALLPIPMLWNVKMSKQAKITVVIILGLGIFASIATLVRIRFLPEMENTDDILYAGTDAMVWTIIEPGLAIIASSLATIRPLLRAMRIRGFESTQASNSNSRQNNNNVPPPRPPPPPPQPPPPQPFAPEDVQNPVNLMVPPRMFDPISESDKSEVYVIQGAVEDAGSTRSISSDREPIPMHDLEAQSQEMRPAPLRLESVRKW